MLHVCTLLVYHIIHFGTIHTIWNYYHIIGN